MREQDSSFDFVKHIREIEEFKVGMLTAVSEVYELMQASSAAEDALGEALCGVVCSAMNLAQCLGISQEHLQRRIEQKLQREGSLV